MTDRSSRPVELDAETGRYRLGIRLVRLANAVLTRLDVGRVARPHLEELVRLTGETATLHVPGEEDAVTVDFVPSPHFVRHVSQLGRPSIAHATSAGKVMLAFTGRPLPRGPLRATRTGRSRIARRSPRRSSACGSKVFAEAFEERELGRAAVAAPVWSSAGALEAIVALQGPTARLAGAQMRASLAPLLEHASASSAALGGHGPSVAR